MNDTTIGLIGGIICVVLGCFGGITARATVTVEKEVETNSLKELRAQADKVLKQTNVSARANIDVVFKLVDGLIEANQLEDAEKYVTKGLEHFPWNLEYQMTYAELLARLGKTEKAKEKATLVFQSGESGELIERARKFLNKNPLPEFPEISALPGTNHCIVLVPLQECDKWLILRIKEGLSATLGVPVYIQAINTKYPTFSRDRRRILIDGMRQQFIKEIHDIELADAMGNLNLTKEDLDEEDNVLKLTKYLLRSYSTEALEEFEAFLEHSKGKDPQWNADRLKTIFFRAVVPYRRKNVAYLGITSVDIYARDYNFLFGWANRLCGIMSYCRFTADFNDDIPNQERLAKRALMQSQSSVGLIYGLKRCTDPTCARAYPNSLSEHDAKKGTLCSECRKNFRTTFGQQNKFPHPYGRGILRDGQARPTSSDTSIHGVTGCSDGENQTIINKRAYSIDKKMSIQLPENWTMRNNFNNNLKIAIFSPKEGNDDIFYENILIAAEPVSADINLDIFEEKINTEAKRYRPDFKVLESSEKTISGIKARRNVCQMTFPEFVSKNIQYILIEDNIAYTITASIPELMYYKWQKLMDELCMSFQVQD